jgi:hypothetical protein
MFKLIQYIVSHILRMVHWKILDNEKNLIAFIYLRFVYKCADHNFIRLFVQLVLWFIIKLLIFQLKSRLGLRLFMCYSEIIKQVILQNSNFNPYHALH